MYAIRSYYAQLEHLAAEAVEEVTEVMGEVAAKVKKTALVSPLAPASFPALPVIEGVEFAAIGAGVRYAGRRNNFV